MLEAPQENLGLLRNLRSLQRRLAQTYPELEEVDDSWMNGHSEPQPAVVPAAPEAMATSYDAEDVAALEEHVTHCDSALARAGGGIQLQVEELRRRQEL